MFESMKLLREISASSSLELPLGIHSVRVAKRVTDQVPDQPSHSSALAAPVLA